MPRPTFFPAAAAAAGIAIAVALIAACGSNTASSPTAVAAGSGPTAARFQQDQADAVRFADCMRSDGVAGFPDPQTSPRAFKFSLGPSSGYAQSPAFERAYPECRHLLPDGGPSSQKAAPSQRQIAAILAFARCLRSHGFPSFPDPTSSGQLTHEMVAAAGIDLHQPAVLRTGEECASVTHGVITDATVARFVQGG
jgi:hypothetical protein